MTMGSSLRRFFNEKATASIFWINLSIAFGLGSTAGIIPQLLSDRYARIHHGYKGPICSSFELDTMPDECKLGSDEAQSTMAIAALIMNIFTVLFNPCVGSLSDVIGRRLPMTVGLSLNTTMPLSLILIQVFPRFNPIWYYVAFATTGVINCMSIMFATITDVVPEELRASSIAIVLAASIGGFSLGPSLPLFMSHLAVSIVSLVLCTAAVLLSAHVLPETCLRSPALSGDEGPGEFDEDDNDATEVPEERCHLSLNDVYKSVHRFFIKPLQKVSILKRTKMLRMLTIACFFNAMVMAADGSLGLFYAVSYLNVRDSDLAGMLFAMGMFGIVLQGTFVEPLERVLGERGFLIATFASGMLHNFLYGIARDKKTVYIALCLSQITRLNIPILSSLASKGVSTNEQGQVQGSLFSVGGLAAAIGPVLFQFVYNHTKDKVGPGTMFFVGSLLCGFAAIVVALMPINHRSVSNEDESSPIHQADELEEPLISNPPSD